MTKTETEGRLENVKGRVKEAVGIVTGDRKLESEGAQERAKGTLKKKVGKAVRKVGDILEDVAAKLKN